MRLIEDATAIHAQQSLRCCVQLLRMANLLERKIGIRLACMSYLIWLSVAEEINDIRDKSRSNSAQRPNK